MKGDLTRKKKKRTGDINCGIVQQECVTRESPLVPLTREMHISLASDLSFILLPRHQCFTGKYTTRKIHKNYIRDPSGLFSIISNLSLTMT